MSRTLSLLLSGLLLSTQPLHAEDGVAAASPSLDAEAAAGAAVPEAASPPVVTVPAEAGADTGVAPATEAVATSPPSLPEAEIAPPLAPALTSSPVEEPAVAATASRSLAAAVPSRDAQGLEYEIHRLLAVAGVLGDERSIPSARRLDLYVRQSGLGRWSLESLQYALDDGAPQSLTFDAAQSEVLSARDSALRIARFPFAAGPRVLRVDLRLVKGRDAEAQSKDLSAELRFDKVNGPIELVVLLDTGTIVGPSLRLQRRVASEQAGGQLHGLDLDGLTGGASRYQPGDNNDPALGHARQLLALGDTRGALIELLSIAERRRLPSGALPTFESPYWLETARLLRQEGLLDRAQAICDDLSSRRSIRTEIAVERLAIGEARLAIGDLDGAEKQFALAKPRLPEYRLPDLRTATGMLQLAQQRSREASETLNGTSPDSVEAFRYMSSSIEAVRATAYGRYNLAIATLRNGDVKTALSWLDLLGRTDSDDPELLALRDKANLALGWHFLQEKQGRTALGVLGRVRSEGLSSNRALLGMGWAQLAPAGERLKRTQLSRTTTRSPDQVSDLPAPVRNSLERLRVIEPEVSGGWIGPSSFERDDPPKDRREGLQRALQIWDVLIVRDERDPAVQEARLAVAYAHDQLRDGAAARDAYGVAIDSLRKVDAAIDEETAFVTSGGLRTALTTMVDEASLFDTLDKLHMPPEPSTFPLIAKLDRLQQRNRLQQAMADARLRLDLPSDSGPAVPADLLNRLASFESWLGKQRNGIADEAETTIKARLNIRRDTTRDYLKTALLSLARLEDAPDLESRTVETPDCSDAACP